MKTKEIASAYQISVQAVNKWTPTKRQQAMRLLSAGVNPQVMELVGEVQRLCYAASCVRGDAVMFTCTQHYATLTVGLESATIELTISKLQAEIKELESIINAK